MMFTRLSHFNNRQFFIRLFWHWIAVFILLLLAAWLPFLVFDVSRLNMYGEINSDFPGNMAIAGIPSVFIASILIALLHTRQDRKRNYPKIYWCIWLIPTFILFDINITAYAYYHHYTYTMYKQEHFRLEQRIKENNHPDYASLADYYKNGRGGPKDLPKAQELYKKACDNTAANDDSIFSTQAAISACKETKNYTRVRLLLESSTYLLKDDPYYMVTLATLYEKGLGGPKDPPKAKELYKKACPTKNGLPCKDNNPL